LSALVVAALALMAALSIALAAVEAAFYLVKRRRLAHLAHENPRAALVNRYLDDPPTLLMPVHMGTYTAHVTMTVLIMWLCVDRLEYWGLLVAFLSMLVYLLVFRLTIPYALVRRNPERSLFVLLPVFDLYARALAPLVAALRKRAAMEPGLVAEPEEVARPAAVADAPQPPVHEADEGRLVNALARFSVTLVRDVMTPRPDIVALPLTTALGDLRRTFRETKHTRLPIFGENLDDVVGMITLRDLLDYDGDPVEGVQKMVRPVFLVPATKRISDLLREFQAGRTTMAVVIDEYGGTAGLVTIEDILEEIVGEIKDEYDLEAEPITVEPDGAVLVAGRVKVDRLEQALETAFENGAHVGTVGGLVATAFGRIPKPGERLCYRGFDVEVVEAEKKRVNRVRFRRQAAVEGGV
jgi:CBS domain containing-hemolysin-like protein